MKQRFKTIAALLSSSLLSALLLSVIVSCASELDPMKKLRTPDGSAETPDLGISNKAGDKGQNGEELPDFDWSEYTYTRLSDEKTISIQEYLDREKLDYVLLIFGSKSCGSCLKKAKFVQENWKNFDKKLSKYKARVVGINTDPLSTSAIKAFLKAKGLKFIVWSDPSGNAMQKHFLLKGETKKVPLMTVLSRKGQLNRWFDKEKVDSKDLLSETLALIEEQESRKRKAEEKSKEGPEDEINTENPGPQNPHLDKIENLQKISSRRFNKLGLKQCSRSTPIRDALLGGSEEYLIFHVNSNQCGSNCQTNLAELRKMRQACVIAGKSKCKIYNTFTSVPGNLKCNAGANIYKGGSEFFDVYKTHFNWDYKVTANLEEYSVNIDPVNGPLTLMYHKSGKLLYSKEGKISKNTLLGNMKKSVRAKRPDFKLLGKNAESVSFDNWLGKAKYSIVVTFGYDCSSCVKELSHLSEKGNLVDFCAESNGQCQIAGIETNVPSENIVDQPDPQNPVKPTLAEYYELLYEGNKYIEGFKNSGIRSPYFIDPGPMDEDGLQPDRVFGYFSATFPEWEGLYGTLIYDREGKVVYSGILSDEEDKKDDLFNKIKELIK